LKIVSLARRVGAAADCPKAMQYRVIFIAQNRQLDCSLMVAARFGIQGIW
jgi:tetrahydromethanopterin S-methyltransferase subunit F